MSAKAAVNLIKFLKHVSPVQLITRLKVYTNRSSKSTFLTLKSNQGKSPYLFHDSVVVYFPAVHNSNFET